MDLEYSHTRYRHVVESVFRQPWAILPEKLSAIAELVAMRLDGFRMDPQAVSEIAAAARKPEKTSTGATAVLTLFGTMLNRVGPMEEMSGAVSLQTFRAQFDSALKDERITSIVCVVDSPGGQVSGVPELAQHIFESRKAKPSTAIVDRGLGCSAAFWVASAFGELVASPSAMVGSVGVYMLHEDWSAAAENAGVKFTFISAPKGGFKTEGNEFEPLSAESLEYFEGMVSETYGWFTRDLAKYRGVAESKVLEQFGKGRVYHAEEAVKRGMVDRVETLESVLERHGGQGSAVRMVSQAENSVPVERSQWSDRDREVALELIQMAAEGQEAKVP